MLYVYLYHSLFVLIFYIGKYLCSCIAGAIILISILLISYFLLVAHILNFTVCFFGLLAHTIQSVRMSIICSMPFPNPLHIHYVEMLIKTPCVVSGVVVVTDDFVETLDTLPQLNNELRVGHFNMKASKAKGLAHLLN